MRLIGFLAACTAIGVAVAPASAVPIFVTADADLSLAPYTFAFGSSQFTFSGTGDIFNPVAVKTAGGAEVSSFGGFLGIPVSPTSYFVDRGTVTFGSGMNFAPFATTTTVPYSNGDNFIGLEATIGGQNFFGFAYTSDTTFNGFGFETSPDTPITASINLGVPEPASWAMFIGGFGLIGATMRRRSTSLGFA